MKVLVTGGRDYDDEIFLYQVLNALSPSVIIHGNAKGADEIAGLYAKEKGLIEKVYPANWRRHGKAAGFIRNKQMLQEENPDVVVAFTGGKGTSNMIDEAYKAGVRVIDYRE